MSATNPEISARMDALREKFAARANQQAENLQALVEGDQPVPDYAAIRQLTHSLAGSAGLFGFKDISALAADLEDDLRNGKDRTAIHQRISALTDAIQTALG